MPDGLVLYVAGAVCLFMFVAIVVREDRHSGGISAPTWQGWLLLLLACACMAGGTVLLAVSLFSG